MRTLRTPLLAAVAMALTLAACGAGDDAASPDETAGDADGGATVEIIDNDFAPSDIEVGAGDAVEWENTGDVDHTVTFDDDDSGDLAPGDTHSRTFEEAGDFAYVCTIHPAMEATVTVTG